MSGGFFRGTSADQDTRFSNKQAKLLKSQKFAPELEHLVDMTKVKMDVIRPWIATRVTELLGFEDEVLINFIYGLLDGKEVNGKQVQISLTGFMEKNTGKFMKELWSLLLSAQRNASGVPQQFLDAKEEETRKKKAESDRIANEIQKKKDKESRENEQDRLRKMDDGDEIKAGDTELDPSSKNMPPTKGSHARPEDERDADQRNGVGRNRSRSQSVSRSFSNSRSYSDGKQKFRSVSRSSESRRCSVSSDRMHPSPRRRSSTPRSRHSPSFSRSPVRRRPSYYRRRSPERRRPSYSRRRSQSRSPYRRGSPTPVRRRSRSPYRRRSPTPVHCRSRSPIRRYRSPSPITRRRSPLSIRRRRSPSLVRRRRSPSPMLHGSRSPVRRRSPSPIRRKSPLPVRRRSPSPLRRRSPPPMRRRSPSPVQQRHRRSSSPRRRRSPPSSRRMRRNLSPVGHNHSSMRSTRIDRMDQSDTDDKVPGLSPPPNKSPLSKSPSHVRHRSGSEDRRLSSPYGSSPRQRKARIARDDSFSPEQKPRELKGHRDGQGTGRRNETSESRHSPLISRQRVSPRTVHTPERLAGSRSIDSRSRLDNVESRKKDLETKSKRSSGEGVHSGTDRQRSPAISEDSFQGEKQSRSRLREGKRSDERSCSHKNTKDSDEHHKLETSPVLLEKVDYSNRGSDSDSKGSDKRRTKHKDGKRKHKRSERRKVTSDDDDSSYDSEIDDRKEAKRRKKEEKRLRKEEKRKRSEERRRKREARRAEKLKTKRHDDDSSSDGEHAGTGKSCPGDDEEEAETEQKKLEIELRKKALESLKAKKGISH
ncbi:hypothetical protein ERO13_D13G232000v2 [Gossypium hirsutum]|uniref:Serine/arginine repetitive matrix protein 1 isoform X3 n=1 Tax=Gossypium hirsutum TaxID=3635 RepID=A0A1U8MA40_GOSHI|nr:serine/arginine repetitive matrix protein 1 isoform X3 [Gossypium hirsutum]KAG4113574.1 hypothetical protein ERO13_D13G232000v2 [Gossypium hirsutum]